MDADTVFALAVIGGVVLLAAFGFLCLNVAMIRRELERQGRDQRARWSAGA